MTVDTQPTFSFQPRTPAYDMATPAIGVALPTSVNLLYPSESQSTPCMILDPGDWIISVRQHSH